jgi:acyl carrier protein
MSLASKSATPNDYDSILHTLTELFREVFADPTITLRPETTADDIPAWDSMAQVTLTVEIEHRFKIKIKSAEMEKLRVVGELVELIESRVAQAAA